MTVFYQLPPPQKGFTLIELAVVIAIVGILASVAIPRFADSSSRAEAAVAKDLKSTLISAAAMYTADQGVLPTDFANFVDVTNITAAAPKTISLKQFGPNKVACAVATVTLTCDKGAGNPFDKVKAVYNWNGGAITGSLTGGVTASL